jgi:hypothetical protein
LHGDLGAAKALIAEKKATIGFDPIKTDLYIDVTVNNLISDLGGMFCDGAKVDDTMLGILIDKTFYSPRKAFCTTLLSRSSFPVPS